MLLKLILASGLVVAAAPPAQPVPPVAATPPSLATSNARYTLERSGDGFVRLDRVTGEVSYCRIEGAAGLVCRLAADERAAYQAKIDALSRQAAAQQAPAKQSLAQRQAEASGEISLIAFILKRMIHAAREVSDAAHEERLAEPPRRAP